MRALRPLAAVRLQPAALPARFFCSSSSLSSPPSLPETSSKTAKKANKSKKNPRTPKRPLSPEQAKEKRLSQLARKSKPISDERLPNISTPFADDPLVAGAKQVRIVASAIVERLPVVAADFSEAEAKFLQQKMETEQALAGVQEKLADEYVQSMTDLQQKKRGGGKKTKKKGKKEGEEEGEAGEAGEGEEEGGFEEKQEVIYPKITPDDEANNRKSLYRKLDQRLYLIVKKDRTSHSWQFPQGEHAEEDGDHLRNTAKRHLPRQIGDVETYFVGNTPMTWYAYGLSEAERSKYGGADATKTFFFKAQYVFGEVQPNREAGLVDHLWVTRSELKEYLDPQFLEFVDQALLD